jgi:hypothetical protein
MTRPPNYRVLTILLAYVVLFVPSAVWAAKQAPEVPFSLQLVADEGQAGTLRYAASRYQVQASKSKDGRLEATAVVTGFELSFLGAIPSAGRVEVSLELALTLPWKWKGKAISHLRTFRVAATIEAADGESVVIPETKSGPAIVVTPRIIADAGRPAAVFLKVEVPMGGEELLLPTQRVLRSIQLIGTHGSENSTRQAAGHNFVTGVNHGMAVLTSLETGAELATVVSREGDTVTGLEIATTWELVDHPVITEQVLIDGLHQAIQLPVSRTLTVETMVSAASGQTLALAGAVAGGANPTEILILVSPALLEDAPVPQSLVETRFVLAAGGAGDLAPLEGATERTNILKQLKAEVSEPGSAKLLQREKQSFVVGDRDGETVTLMVESDTALKFSSETLAPGELLLGLDLSAVSFAPEPPKFPLNTASGIKAVELPETRILELNTDVSLRDGESIAAGGGLLEWISPEDSQTTETVFIGTANVDGGMVRFEGRLAQAAVQSSQPGDGPNEVEYECNGSFNRQSKREPGGVEHNIEESLQCRKIVPSL